MTLSSLLAELNARLLTEPPLPGASNAGAVRLFFSVSSGERRALVISVSGDTLAQAWKAGAQSLQTLCKREAISARWLRVDRVSGVTEHTWGSLENQLKRHKRNYFRQGLSLDRDFKQAFLETELNANAMLYGGVKIPHATLNQNNFRRYARLKYGEHFEPSLAYDQPVWTFTTQGWLADSDGKVHALHPKGRNTGRRQIEQLEPDQVFNLISDASEFLSRQVKNSGEFVYGIHPCFNRTINAYNALRHASSTYAMLEAWEVTQSPALKQAIDRSLQYLSGTLIQWRQLEQGEQAAFLVDVGDEIKLGGNAVCLLAFAKYTELTGDSVYQSLMHALGVGIESMQSRETGGFVHVLNAHDLSVKQAFRIIYYDGEAAFGLMRLYGLTGEERWLHCVERAFEYFIEQDHWQAHDHWLSYCVNELTLYRPEARYFEFGLKNVADYLDFVLERITTFPTLLELMMAAHKMIVRLQNDPDHRHLLQTLDLDKFYRALEHRAHYLLNGHFWPELAMYFARPSRIVGSFFIRHHSFRVRIDDVEHYLSGFVAYLLHYLNELNSPRVAHPVDAIPAATSASPLMGGYQAQGVLAWGGDVNLGRRQHYRTQQSGFAATLAIPEFTAADLTVVNLECVVSHLGEQGVNKGEGGPYYYRARPEMLQVLTEAGVDMVTVANNHSGDYGPEALMQQQQILEAIGISSVGSGADQNAAFAPAYARVGEVTVAIFAIDSTQHRFAAKAQSPGAAYLPSDQPALWYETLQPLVADAKRRADLVLIAVHWGANQADQPDTADIAIGHALIDAGADAILGASAHRLQGIEVYSNRPIIHDAGDLLFDAVRHDLAEGGVFQLGLTKQGVNWVRFIPIGIGFGFTRRLEGGPAHAAVQSYSRKCKALGTELETGSDNAYFLLGPPEPITEPRQPSEQRHYQLDALNQFPVDDRQFTVEQVPEEVAIEPVHLNGLVLLGVRVHPARLTRRRMLWVETWWQLASPSADTAATENLRLDYLALPLTEHRMPVWGKAMDHDPCDWMQPTSTWQAGKIYRDFYGLRPPHLKRLINDQLQLQIRVLGGRQGPSEAYVYPERIQLDIPSLRPKTLSRDYRVDFTGIDLQVTPGQTWTAEQLKQITGGRWLVEPSQDWYVRSVVNGAKFISMREAPVFFVAHTNHERAFHEGSTRPVRSLGDRHLTLKEKATSLAGALVSKPVSGIPSDFPLLKVDDPIKAIIELGLAARQRYEGPVIAVTGTAGKSSTIGPTVKKCYSCGNSYRNICSVRTLTLPPRCLPS